MDFIDRLKDQINTINGLPLQIRKGYLTANESLVIYPLPGSVVTQEFYDGVKDQQLNYEIAMKSKDGNKIESTLWLISDFAENLNAVTSNDGSFEFNGLQITNKPYINNADEQGWFIFLLDLQAQLTTFEGEKQ